MLFWDPVPRRLSKRFKQKDVLRGRFFINANADLDDEIMMWQKMRCLGCWFARGKVQDCDTDGCKVKESVGEKECKLLSWKGVWRWSQRLWTLSPSVCSRNKSASPTGRFSVEFFVEMEINDGVWDYCTSVTFIWDVPLWRKMQLVAIDLTDDCRVNESFVENSGW